MHRKHIGTAGFCAVMTATLWFQRGVGGGGLPYEKKGRDALCVTVVRGINEGFWSPFGS